MNSDTRARIRAFIIRTYLFDDPHAGVADEDSLLSSNIVDSTGILELIMLVEDEFGLSVPDEDVTPEHFDSIARLALYVEARTGSRAVAA